MSENNIITDENQPTSIWCFMAKVFIEPVNGRKQMNENVNLSCALQGTYDRWDSIPWRKVIHEVTRQQRRIAKAVQQKQFGKAKRLMFLLSKSFYAKLLAVRRVTMNKGEETEETTRNRTKEMEE